MKFKYIKISFLYPPQDPHIICYFICQCSLAVFTAKDNKVSHMVKQKQFKCLLGYKMFICY